MLLQHLPVSRTFPISVLCCCCCCRGCCCCRQLALNARMLLQHLPASRAFPISELCCCYCCGGCCCRLRGTERTHATSALASKQGLSHFCALLLLLSWLLLLQAACAERTHAASVSQILTGFVILREPTTNDHRRLKK
ncbi:unnamed protein product [Polarella glacialis]|uniref:Secreted protein n=1 Tax=Polarella glacialis TaxID=89957 RepID=A0A813H0V6_POLGL|nr:unnamed protein product [Polarella glacialis]